MMYGWYGGYDMWNFVSMIVMMALVAVAIILIVRYLSHGDMSSRSSGETALDILKKRYAKGEIDKQEFEAKRKDLSE